MAVVDIVLEVVSARSSKSFSSDSDSDSWSSADCPSRSPVVVVCVEIVWDSVVLVAGWFCVEPVVTCARPTPAAAANARPASAPTRERRVRRVSLLRTWNPFGAWRVGAYVWSVAIDGRNLRPAPSFEALQRRGCLGSLVGVAKVQPVSRSARPARSGSPQGLAHNRADTYLRTAPIHQPTRLRASGAGRGSRRCRPRRT